ncbi:hypothetical protein MHYP_G00355480 [Metynnis hypsauchen]
MQRSEQVWKQMHQRIEQVLQWNKEQADLRRNEIESGPLDEVSLDITPPLLDVIEGEPVYAVRRPLDAQRQGGILQYFVDREGYDQEEQCWVLTKDVLDPALIVEFHCRHPIKPAP